MNRQSPEDKTAFILVTIDALARRGLVPLREYELHQVFHELQHVNGQLLRFVERPIPYSFELLDLLNAMEQDHYVYDLVLVRNGWVPRHEYDLSLIGRAQAEEERERMQYKEPRIIAGIRSVLDSFQASHEPVPPISPHL